MSWGNNQDGWNTGSGDWDIPKKVEQDKPRDEAVEWGTGASKGMTTRDAGDNADASGADGAGGGCRNCGAEGHFARECPEPKQANTCFNCSQEGHNKSECPNPRVFQGECRVCSKPGHPAAECPDRPPDKCRNCLKEGHKAADCTENRAIDYSNVVTMSSEEAWRALIKADAERDLDDFREAIQIYKKAESDTDYCSLENAFRAQKFQVHLIAYEKEVSDTFTLMDLNGKLGCKYHVGFFFSPKPPRGSMKEGWPKTPEENKERLRDAGIPVDRGIPKCSNCSGKYKFSCLKNNRTNRSLELGHIAKACPQEKMERTDRPQVACIYCEQLGHRARDCPGERVDPYACKRCKQPGHIAKDCTEPQSAEGIECKYCSKMGHFARDCPEREALTCRNCGGEGHRARDCTEPKVIRCFNCEKEGHQSRECPEPRDYSKVKCQNCGEMGHTKVRCKAPPKDDEEGGLDNGYGAAQGRDTADSGWDKFSGGNRVNGAASYVGVTAASTANVDGW